MLLLVLQLSFSMVTVTNGLEVSPNDDTEDDIDFTQAVLDPDTGLMCVYNQGWDNLQKNVRIISTHETFFHVLSNK